MSPAKARSNPHTTLLFQVVAFSPPPWAHGVAAWGSRLRGAVAVALLVCGGSGSAEQAHNFSAAQEQELTGEVVALWCHLNEGSFGTGRLNNQKQRTCIRLGSPISLKVSHSLYLVSVEDQTLKHRLTILAGHRVTARGTVTEQDGQQGIAITHVEAAK